LEKYKFNRKYLLGHITVVQTFWRRFDTNPLSFVNNIFRPSLDVTHEIAKTSISYI